MKYQLPSIAATKSALKLSDLSAPRHILVRLFQSINYGQVQNLEIRRGEPVFNPPPIVLFDVKLDSEEEARPEVALDDFWLCEEVRRLVARLDSFGDGTIERIEVRAGIPRRLVLQCRIAPEVLE